ncbi:MAG: ABC transporter permease [Thermoanaerobaculaceae bacterium]
METVLNDLRFAFRMLAKRPAFTVVAVLVLAIGIGATTTIQVWMRATLFRPLPAVPAQGELVVVAADRSNGTESYFGISYPEFLEASRSVADTMGLLVQTERAWSLERSDGPERVWGSFVSRNFFDVLGVHASLGRTFNAGDEGLAPAGQEVVISHALWKRAFGGAPDAIGRNVVLNGRSLTLLGVMPERFKGSEGGLQLDLFVPVNCPDSGALGAPRLDARDNPWLQPMGRLAPGVGRARAESALRAAMQRIAAEHPEVKRDRGPALFPLWRAPGGGAEFLGPALLALGGLALAVLLVASTNVAGMLLARSTGRQREIAVRMSVGAPRARVIRQLLTESLVLAGLAGLAGVGVAALTSGLLNAFVPPIGVPIAIDTRLDPLAVATATLVAFATTFVFGLAPALHASRVDVAGTLKAEGRGTTASRGRARLRSALVVAQLAFSLLLLVCAGLFAQSYRAVQGFAWGFDPSGVLLASVDPASQGYDLARQARFCRELVQRLEALPGVAGVTLAKRAPLSTGGISWGDLEVDGYQPSPDEKLTAFAEVVAPGYFSTLAIPLAKGRELTFADDAASGAVVVINETVAARYFRGRDPVGARLVFWGRPRTVVGVARDVKLRRLTDAPAPVLFLPTQQVAARHLTIMVRGGDPAALAAAVRREVAAVDPRLPTFDVRTLEAHLGLQSMPQRMGGSLAGVFGLVALLLATVGLYGVVAQIVAQRTHELGVRMALGATRGQVTALVLRRAAWMTGAGVGVGLVVALAAERALRSVLFGMTGFSLGSFAAATGVLIGAMLAASLLPARRAGRLDPVRALRYE